MHRISFLGYGRFGAALGRLFVEQGAEVRALDPDPAAGLDPALRVSSLPELVAGAEFVVLAVPVPRMAEALSALAPQLLPGPIVLDVGSVKVRPVQAMAAQLGARVPWVGTHPLFGPASLARGERPLRVVVCPNPQHPRAVERVAALFSGIGCQVLEQDAEEHDRVMAWTQALAFFVAKGMLDAGVAVDVPHAPPSFQGLARTIEAVRADAGHLFQALHRENPYAGEARRRLLQALVAADQHLSGPGAEEGAAGAPIPDLGQRSPALLQTRELIDEVDQELVALLGRRAQLSLRAAQAKAELGLGVQDPAREARLLESRAAWAQDLGLPEGPVREIFQAVLNFSRKVQEDP